MTTIKALKTHLSRVSTPRLAVDDKVHLLYVSPQLNARGYYRMIAQALELNKTQTHKALFTSIENNDFSFQFDTHNMSLSEPLLAWADYIILPTLMEEISYLIKAIRSINGSAKLVMDVDRNYFDISKEEALEENLNPVDIEQLLSNLDKVDVVTVSGNTLDIYFEDLYNTFLKDAPPKVCRTPSLLSKYGYEEHSSLKKNETSKIRIGFIKPTAESLLPLKEVLLEISTSFSDEIEFVCFGKPYASKEVDKLLKELKAEIHNTVSFLLYYEKLNDLKLDFVVLPTKESRYYEERTSNIYMELGALGIATIASNNESMSALIQDHKTGLLANDILGWKSCIELLIINTSKRIELGKNAFKHVWKHHSYTKNRIAQIQDIFI